MVTFYGDTSSYPSPFTPSFTTLPEIIPSPPLPPFKVYPSIDRSTSAFIRFTKPIDDGGKDLLGYNNNISS